MRSRDNSLDTLTFQKDKVLTALKENREKHLGIVQEAQLGFREKWEEKLVKALRDLRDGKKVPPTVSLHVPESHVDDFDRVICMLGMSREEQITLTQSEFQSFVMNEWSWAQGFLISNSAYSGRARAAVHDEQGYGEG